MNYQWSKKDGAYIVIPSASMKVSQSVCLPASQPIGHMFSGQSVTEQIRQLIEKFSLVPRR